MEASADLLLPHLGSDTVPLAEHDERRIGRVVVGIAELEACLARTR